MGSHSITCHLAEAASAVLTGTRFIKDERLSSPEPTQVNDLPRFPREVPTIPGVSWLSQPSASLGTEGVNN